MGRVPRSHQPHPSRAAGLLRAPGRLLLAGALAAAGVGALPVATARAAACPPSGGVAIPPATAPGDVVFRGGGWGHGLGMSQYGAQGAARLGCNADQILTRYYAGTEVVVPADARQRPGADARQRLPGRRRGGPGWR